MNNFTHFDQHGRAVMVDVTEKQETHRVAVAMGRIHMLPDTLTHILAGQADKGDVLGVARIAAIQATKRTADLIPLCHPIALTKVAVEFIPIVDSLSAFYGKYQSIYVTPIVDQGTRKVARDLLFKYKPTDLTKDEYELEVLKAIKANPAIMNYVEIKKVGIVELRY